MRRSSPSSLLSLFLISCLFPQSANGFAFVSQSLHRGPTSLKMSSEAGGMEAMSLKGLEDDHEAEGTRMATSIAAWLDAEWMEQEVHVRMAESAKSSYITCRQKGDHEIMSIMICIAEDLDKNWHLYDADAFVNAWDVGNYVSDYLAKKIVGVDECGCSSEIY